MRVLWQPLEAGDVGIAQTLAAMYSWAVGQATTDPVVVQTARDIVAPLPSRDPAAWGRAIVTWTRQHYRFVRDPVRYELFMAPRQAIDQVRSRGYFQEDCDGAAVVVAALAEAVGIPTRFRVFAQARPSAGDSHFQHVLPELQIGGRWIPWDPTQPGRPIGWTPPTAGRQATYGGHGMAYRFNGYMAEDFAPSALMPDVGAIFQEQPTLTLTTTWPATSADPAYAGIPTVTPGVQYDAPYVPASDPNAPNPFIPEAAQVMLPPSGSPGMANQPAGPGSSGIFADVSSGITKILAGVTGAAAASLPLLERYGAIRPVVGQPRRLPLPGESYQAYIASGGYLPRGVSPTAGLFTGLTSLGAGTYFPLLLLGGIAVIAVMAARSGGGRARATHNPRRRSHRRRPRAR